MTRPLFSTILLVIFSLLGTAEALTVYRLGGADQPPPQLEASFNFIPLPWSDLDDQRGGNAQDLNISANFISPLLIDPEENLALTLREGLGLTYLWFGDWRKINNNGRDFFLFNLIDSEVDLEFAPIRTRRLLFQVLARSEFWKVGELEVYGTGLVPQARYQSNVIDLGEPLVLGPLTWTGERGDDTKVELRLRRGDDDDPNQYWRRTFRGDEQVPFSSTGDPLTRSQYDRLELTARGDIRLDTDNWQPWSAPFDFDQRSAVAVVDRPRRFVQFEVAFTSTREQGGRLNFVQFAASPPLISQAVAEVEPDRATAGETTAFVYKLRPQLEPGDRGFDSIRIETPARVLGVEPLGHINGREVELVTTIDETGFSIQIPRFELQQTEELIEIGFQAKVFEYGTPFFAHVFDSAVPFEIAQPALEGDADERNDSRTVRVALHTIPQRALGAVRLSSGVLTPNGDGANDIVDIEYEVLNLTQNTPADIEIYDLAGRRVAVINAGNPSSGVYSALWDGSGPDGQLLVPGLYLLQLKIATDTHIHRVQRLLSLVY